MFEFACGLAIPNMPAVAVAWRSFASSNLASKTSKQALKSRPSQAARKLRPEKSAKKTCKAEQDGVELLCEAGGDFSCNTLKTINPTLEHYPGQSSDDSKTKAGTGKGVG